MNPPLITGLYAGILAIIAVFLSIRVVQFRIRTGVGIGDKGQPDLKRVRRVHANFTEYVPFALLLLALLETLTAPEHAMRIHGLGATLVLARVLHALGLSRKPGMTLPRGSGYTLTILVMLCCAGMLILHFFQNQA